MLKLAVLTNYNLGEGRAGGEGIIEKGGLVVELNMRNGERQNHLVISPEHTDKEIRQGNSE